MKVWSILRSIFTLGQIGLTIYFICDSINNWNDTPIVTTVSFEKLTSQEPFPAISLCFDHAAWKWPSIISLATKWNQTSQTNVSLSYMNYYVEQIAQMKVQTKSFKTTKYLKIEGTQFEFDVCKFATDLFSDIDDQEIKDFLLKIAYQIDLDPSSDWFLLGLMKSNLDNFVKMKENICNVLNCSQLQDDHCSTNRPMTYKRFEAIIEVFNIRWAYIKYYNYRFLLLTKIFKVYQDPHPNNDLDDMIALFNDTIKISSIDIFSIWHYLKGLQKNDTEGLEFMEFLVEKDKFEDPESFIQTLDQDSFNRLMELIDQPKANSLNKDNFNLVPFCSYGHDNPLQSCILFEKSKFMYQDDTCYTFDHDQGKTSMPYAPNGLNLVLNIKGMPSEEVLALKVFVHEHGTYPDVLGIESTHQEITSNGRIKIGIEVTGKEVTENFAKMPFTKRKCLLPNERPNYNRLQCLVDYSHQRALDQCQCLPANMVAENQWNICTLNGSFCFRNEVQRSKSSINDTLCPPICQGRQFKTYRTLDETWNALKKGQDFLQYLDQNPLTTVLEMNSTGQDLGEIQTHRGYLKKSSESYTYLQIFFEDPQKIVITQDAKVTETDMVSNIGGTIGIFLGLSAISFLDIIADWVKDIIFAFKSFKSASKTQ